MSGSEPSEHLSSDLESVVVAGLKWFPKGDFIKMNFSEINFAKKERGRKPLHKKGCIPDKLTRRDCVSRVAEVFDPLGEGSTNSWWYETRYKRSTQAWYWVG